MDGKIILGQAGVLKTPQVIKEASFFLISQHQAVNASHRLDFPRSCDLTLDPLESQRACHGGAGMGKEALPASLWF